MFPRPLRLLLIAVAPLLLSGCFTVKLRELRTEVQMKEARIMQLHQDLQACREERAVVAGEIEGTRARLAEREELLAKLQERLHESESQLAASRVALQSSVESTKSELSERLAQALEVEREYREEAEGLRNRIAALEGEVLETEQERIELEEQAAEQERILEARREVVASLEGQVAAQRGELEELRAAREREVANHQREVTELETELSAANEKIASLTTDVRLLNDLVERKETTIATLERNVPAAETVAMSQKQVEAEGTGAAPEQLEAAAKAAREAMAPSISEDFASVEVREEAVAIVLLCDEIFQPATTLLSDRGLRALQQAEAALESIAHNGIVVAGHTDNVPVRNMPYPDNWELAAARASEVVRWLAAQPSLLSEKIVAQSHSYHEPIAENSTASGRRLNRRVEILVSPQP